MSVMAWATVAAFVVGLAVIGIAYLLTGGADLTFGAGILVVAVSYVLAIAAFWLIVWFGGDS